MNGGNRNIGPIFCLWSNWGNEMVVIAISEQQRSDGPAIGNSHNKSASQVRTKGGGGGKERRAWPMPMAK